MRDHPCFWLDSRFTNRIVLVSDFKRTVA